MLRIREAIEKDIITGKLAPGTKLDEEALAARYGASRTPVREAFQQLASQGHIALRPHMGAFVATLSVTELVEMFEAMAYLEAACAALASRRHTDADRTRLAAAHGACVKAAKRKDPDAFYAANARFHECIYAASHNEYLAAETLRLRNRLEAYRRESTFHPGLMALTINEHVKILQAILDMDEAAAASRMRGHLDTLRDDAVSMARAVVRATGRRAA
ncbi:MAG: GntR family transcriptional regulator [Betaproteobacteria bacterium]|nr:MAG: GntR family transcriptional regulator [Betaproteobacteria bacterium]